MADGGVGETALLSEITASDTLAAANLSAYTPELMSTITPNLELGGLGGLLGGGASFAGTGLGAGGVGGGLGSITAAAAPEAAAQVQAAIQAAAPGANQLAGNLGTPAQSAMNVDSQNFNPQALQTAEIAPNVQAGSAINTPYEMTQANPNLPGAMTGTPNPLPASFTGERGGLGDLVDWYKNLKPAEQMLYGGAAALAAPTIMSMFKGKPGVPQMAPYSGPLSKFRYDPSQYTPLTVTPPTPYTPQYKSYAGGGPVEQMANANAIGQNTGYPMANIHQGAYATPYQTPISQNVLSGPADTNVDPYTGEEKLAAGGIASLGAYSDGGQMLKGPGDGMSDNIPATIAGKQPARLANDEFVVPADVVSHLGNGSSDAGAKQLYKMMDRVRQARTGKKDQGKEIKPDKYLPA